MRRINYKSDIPPLLLSLKVDEKQITVPDCDFIVRFYIEGYEGRHYDCSHIGGVWSNCEPSDDGTKLVCYINNQRLGIGELCAEFHYIRPERRYSDGSQKSVVIIGSTELGVELVEDNGDAVTEASIDVTLPFIYRTAYEIARDHGYTGTAEDFYGALASVVGIAEAEKKRVTAEITRNANEQERIENEENRLNAESDRVNAEAQRVRNEAIRRDAESDRVEQEEDRKAKFEEITGFIATVRANEGNRESNERERQANEDTRITEEAKRVEAEKKRAAEFEQQKLDLAGKIDRSGDEMGGDLIFTDNAGVTFSTSDGGAHTMFNDTDDVAKFTADNGDTFEFKQNETPSKNSSAVVVSKNLYNALDMTLESMGSALDGDAAYRAEAGDKIFNPDTCKIQIYNSTIGGFKDLCDPIDGKLYANKMTGYIYRWDTKTNKMVFVGGVKAYTKGEADSRFAKLDDATQIVKVKELEANNSVTTKSMWIGDEGLLLGGDGNGHLTVEQDEVVTDVTLNEKLATKADDVAYGVEWNNGQPTGEAQETTVKEATANTTALTLILGQSCNALESEVEKKADKTELDTIKANVDQKVGKTDIVQSTGTSTTAVMSQKAVSDIVDELESQVIYDVTANNSGATFDSLSALLSNENLSTLIPSEVRCGGMSIRFVQSYGNKYVQCRLKSQTFSTAESDWELSASIDELEELRDSILGAESVSTDITASSTYYITDAFIAADGTITISSAYKCTTKPYFLKRGHTIKFKGKNGYNRILAYTTQQSVAVGDTVTLLPTTHTEDDYHIYTADVDRNIIISYNIVTSVIDVSPAVEGALVEIENKIESLHGDIDAVENEIDEVETRINDINNEINGNGGVIDISHIHGAPDNLHAFIGNNGLIQLSSVNYTTQPYLLKSGHAIWVKGNAGSNKTLIASTTKQSVAVGDTVTPLSTIYHEGDYHTYVNNGDDMLVVVNSVYNPEAPVQTIIKDVSNYLGGLIDKKITSYASSSIPAIGNLDVAYPNYDYCHIITYGQSFSEGGGGVGKYDVIPGNYMVGDSVQITNKSNRTYLSGLRSDRNGAIAAQCTNAFSLLWRKYHNANTKFIASAGGHGGATLLEISKGTTYYSQFLDELNAAKTIADTDSKSIGCIAILFIQGESGAGTGYDTKSDYIYLINKLKEDMQSDIMSIYGQSVKPVFITYQTGYKWIRNKPNGPIPTAQLEYAMDNEDVILGCPSYFAAFTNTNHPSGNGYSMIGELMSKYLYGVMTDRRIQSVYPYSIKAEGHCIDIMCNVTVPPLQIDIHTVSQVPNYGFKVYVNNLTYTISDIKVIGNMIRLVTNEDVSDQMVEVSYAIDNATNGRGNICDSDDKYMSYQTYGEELASETMQDYPVDINGRTLYGKRLPLQNWLSNFYKNVRFGFIRHCVRAKTTDASFVNKLTNELGLEVIYTSSNSSVATVGSNGALTFVDTGYSVITASVTFNSVTYTDDYLLIVEQ